MTVAGIAVHRYSWYLWECVLSPFMYGIKACWKKHVRASHVGDLAFSFRNDFGKWKMKRSLRSGRQRKRCKPTWVLVPETCKEYDQNLAFWVCCFERIGSEQRDNKKNRVSLYLQEYSCSDWAKGLDRKVTTVRQFVVCEQLSPNGLGGPHCDIRQWSSLAPSSDQSIEKLPCCIARLLGVLLWYPVFQSLKWVTLSQVSSVSNH